MTALILKHANKHKHFFYAPKIFRLSRSPTAAVRSSSRMTASEEPQRIQTAVALFIRHYEFLKCCLFRNGRFLREQAMADFKSQWFN